MGTTAHDIIQWPLTNDIKNAYRYPERHFGKRYKGNKKESIGS